MNDPRKPRTVNVPTEELVAVGAPVQLRDGSRIRVRQGSRSDRDLLLRGFDRLSEESRYRRFLGPTPELRDEMLRFLLDVDHHDHEAIVAVEDETGDGLGVARYVRLGDEPDVAELAITVVDDWQHRGLGTLLLEVIGARAREEGITTFSALMLATNREMLEILEHAGPMEIVDSGSGTVQVSAAIQEAGLSPALGKLLQVAARRDAAVPLAGRRTVPPAGRERES
ncbi:MAG: GNAT family N-acetyltransferase [Solirubrobacterales bacterium]|nr:GNAT family N-acetyltransferase [Solirubrobacterales bacterium]